MSLTQDGVDIRYFSSLPRSQERFVYLFIFILLTGYYSELPSMEMAAFNQTLLLVDPRSQKRIKLSYSYLGAVLIGIGGEDKPALTMSLTYLLQCHIIFPPPQKAVRE